MIKTEIVSRKKSRYVKSTDYKIYNRLKSALQMVTTIEFNYI